MSLTPWPRLSPTTFAPLFNAGITTGRAAFEACFSVAIHCSRASSSGAMRSTRVTPPGGPSAPGLGCGPSSSPSANACGAPISRWCTSVIVAIFATGTVNAALLEAGTSRRNRRPASKTAWRAEPPVHCAPRGPSRTVVPLGAAAAPAAASLLPPGTEGRGAISGKTRRRHTRLLTQCALPITGTYSNGKSTAYIHGPHSHFSPSTHTLPSGGGAAGPGGDLAAVPSESVNCRGSVGSNFWPHPARGNQRSFSVTSNISPSCAPTCRGLTACVGIAVCRGLAGYAGGGGVFISNQFCPGIC
eukprot:m.231956 g.231956  ORF g.231956 m.231956 type:complete len:301 (+) comp15703_c0_seq3:247-1149(+)